jgi:8-amino-7-oxononanoate synthase
MSDSFKPMIINHLPSRTVQLDGIEHLFFSGTSYLGMGHQAEFKEALMEGMQQYGTIFSASRNNNLQLDIYEEAECFLAQWTGAEAALTVTSGLLAGQLAVQNIKNQRFVYAPSVHPAIWREKPEILFNDYEQFKNEIPLIVLKEKKPITICCNSIDPLKCVSYDFSWISELPNDQEITLIFDDSHAIGVENTEGVGNFKNIKKYAQPNVKIIIIASLAKALGIPGGVILSDKMTIQSIRQNPLFVGASPIVPAYLYAFLKAQNVYKNARLLLNKNIQLFKKLNIKYLVFFQFNEQHPVFFTKENDIYIFLLNHKILISSFSYPNPNDPPITRIVLSALHTEGDIARLSKCLSQYFLKEIVH